MRVLLDQGLAPRAAGLLRSEGWDATHVTEVGLDRSSDLEILEYCQTNNLACITLDHDFHLHLTLTSSKGPSAILVRAEGLTAERQAELVKHVWKACGEAIKQGAAVSTDGRVVRLRRLPLK